MSNIKRPTPSASVMLLMQRVGRGGGGVLSIRVAFLFFTEFEIHFIVAVTDLSDNLTIFEEPVLI